MTRRGGRKMARPQTVRLAIAAGKADSIVQW